MLVESVDGQSALLGRPRSLRRRGPVLTCLSGFIEQGESIEEAVHSSLDNLLKSLGTVFSAAIEGARSCAFQLYHESSQCFLSS